MRAIAARYPNSLVAGNRMGEAAAGDCGPVYARSSPALHLPPCRSMPALGTTTIPTTSGRRTSIITLSCAAASKLAASTASEADRAKAAGRGPLGSAAATRSSLRADTRPAATYGQTLIALAFRRMLARADLRERPDAKPGPPRRAPPDEIAKPSPPMPPYDREIDRRLGPMVRNERRFFVRSGELVVGMLNRATRGPESWSWFMTGVSRPHDEDFVWRGEIEADDEAFDALAACWSR